LLKGGESKLAITKERKDELVAQYVEWVKRSQALFLTQYTGMTMKQVDDLRGKTREAGAEFHVLKNTLARVAFEKAGLKVPEHLLETSSAAVFVFNDVPGVAKTLTEFARTNEFVKVKGGYLEKRSIRAEDVKALADLPPLPVIRAQLLGVINAPATKLVRTLAEPGRGLAAVIKARVDAASAPAEAAAAEA
jgi:large subunit ribosomal protein L10